MWSRVGAEARVTPAARSLPGQLTWQTACRRQSGAGVTCSRTTASEVVLAQLDARRAALGDYAQRWQRDVRATAEQLHKFLDAAMGRGVLSRWPGVRDTRVTW